MDSASDKAISGRGPLTRLGLKRHREREKAGCNKKIDATDLSAFTVASTMLGCPFSDVDVDSSQMSQDGNDDRSLPPGSPPVTTRQISTGRSDDSRKSSGYPKSVYYWYPLDGATLGETEGEEMSALKVASEMLHCSLGDMETEVSGTTPIERVPSVPRPPPPPPPPPAIKRKFRLSSYKTEARFSASDLPIPEPSIGSFRQWTACERLKDPFTSIASKAGGTDEYLHVECDLGSDSTFRISVNIRLL